MGYDFDWGPIWANRDLIASGLGYTLALSVLGLLTALTLGTLMGTTATSHRRAPRAVAAGYVELSRNIPLLIHMYIWYMGLSFLRLPPFACAIIALTLYSGAYVTEVVRSGINAVPKAQLQAALASGMRPGQAHRLVVYPQAFRIIAPSLAGLCSQLIKDSSLASVIAVAELTYQAGAIEGRTFRTFEAYLTITVLYLAIVTLVSQIVLHLARPEGRGRQRRGIA